MRVKLTDFEGNLSKPPSGKPTQRRRKMRVVKAFGLALFATALIGVASASAYQETVLCKANVEVCKGENVSGYAFTSSPVEAKFDFGESKKVQCSSQMIRGEDERISTLSFSGCTEGCTASATGLPYYASMYEPVAGSGKMEMFVGGLAFKCGTSECVYKGSASGLPVEGGTPANVHVSKTLKEEAGSFFCPKTVQWEADYTFKIPSAATYVTQRGIEGPLLCSANESPCAQKSIQLYNEFESVPKTNVVIGLFPGGSQVSCTSDRFGFNNFEPYKPGGQWNYKPQGPSGCTSPVYTSCTVWMTEPPYLSTLTPSEKGNGTIQVVESALGIPTLNVKCSSGGVPFTCVFTSPSFSLKFTGGAPAKLSTTATYNRQSGSVAFCSKSVTLSAEYQSVLGQARYMAST